MKRKIKLTESNLIKTIKKIVAEQEERTKEERDWDEREDTKEEIYNDIYDILEPVLETLYKKHGENDLIDLDDEISFVIQDWWDAGRDDEEDKRRDEWEERGGIIGNRRSDGPTKGY